MVLKISETFNKIISWNAPLFRSGFRKGLVRPCSIGKIVDALHKISNV